MHEPRGDIRQPLRACPAPEETDVLVIGAGPCGSAVAAWLARRGRRVTLVEKGHHPRFHIGESLLPMSMPLLEDLGVRERVEALGVIKRGADFPSAGPMGYQVFSFRRSLNPTYPHAVQIAREDLDRLLFETAAAAGVTTVEETAIDEVRLAADHVEAGGRQRDGRRVSYRARYLVDATGRDTLLGRKLKLKRRHRTHQSAALYAHMTGIQRRAGDDAGNISIYRVEDGWIWIIPLPNGITSVGLVCGPESLRERGGDSAGYLLRTLAGVPGLAERLDAPVIVGRLQATGNYSYQCTRFAGPRWIMAGDATAFVDPIFSAGVHMALHTAQAAARLVDQVLDAPHLERALQRDYSRAHRAALARVSWFIVRFNTPVMRRLFARPRNDWRLEEAIISMLAGDLYRDGGIGWRLRVFKLIYTLASILDLRGAGRGFRQRWRRAREIYATDPGPSEAS